MPFKTRKQKATAAARRFQFTNLGYVTYGAKSIQGATEAKAKLADDRPQTHQNAVENLSYIGADLIKIIILATLIILAQIAIGLIRA